MRALFATAVLVPLAASGAGQKEIVAEYRDREIREADLGVALERRGCLGTCPAYRLTIDGTGEVEYRGIAFVKKTGEGRTTVSPEEVLKLVNAMLGARFFDVPDEFVTTDRIHRTNGKLYLWDVFVTDGPSTILHLRIGEHEKRVLLYAGYPQELGAIARLIDETVDVEQWIGKPCERMRYRDGRLVPGECADPEPNAPSRSGSPLGFRKSR